MKKKDGIKVSYVLDKKVSEALEKFCNETARTKTKVVEMYQKVLQILYAEDKTVITKLALSEDDGLALHFSFDSTAFIKSVEIGDGILVWTNTNTQSKLSNLNKLFNLYGIDPSELTFYL